MRNVIRLKALGCRLKKKNKYFGVLFTETSALSL
jgi:hypothetical protein